MLSQTMRRKTAFSCAVSSSSEKYVGNSILFHTYPPHLHHATSVMIPGASSNILLASAFFLFLLDAASFTPSCPSKCSVLNYGGLCTKYCPCLTTNVAWCSFLTLTRLLSSSTDHFSRLSYKSLTFLADNMISTCSYDAIIPAFSFYQPYLLRVCLSLRVLHGTRNYLPPP